MKIVWKWILGIVIVLVVVGLVVGVVFAFQRGMTRTPFAYRTPQQNPPSSPNTTRPQNNQSNPTTPNRPMPSRGYGFGPMMGRGFGYGPVMGHGGYGYGSMMMHRGFSTFFFGFSMLFGLVKLALFGLLLYGAYWLGRRSVMPVAAPVAPAPVSDPDPAPQRGRKSTKS